MVHWELLVEIQKVVRVYLAWISTGLNLYP